MLVAVVAAAAAAAIDRRELRTAAVVDLAGASPRQRRLMVAAEAVEIGLLALPLGLAAGTLAGRALGPGRPGLVGAPPAVLRRTGAVQALVLGVAAVPFGVATGALAVGAGIDRYNASGRGELPPIPFAMPTSLLVAAVAVPLVAAGLGWLIAARRPPVDPVSLPDRLAW